MEKIRKRKAIFRVEFEVYAASSAHYDIMCDQTEDSEVKETKALAKLHNYYMHLKYVKAR